MHHKTTRPWVSALTFILFASCAELPDDSVDPTPPAQLDMSIPPDATPTPTPEDMAQDSPPDQSDPPDAGEPVEDMAPPPDQGDDPPPDMSPPAPPEGVPVFMAIGNGGRRMHSCDLGVTWRGDVSLSSADSGKHPDAGKDVVIGGGVAIAGFGWGHPAQLWRSTSGADWAFSLEPEDGVNGAGGVVYGDGRFLAMQQLRLRRSSDGGVTWQTGRTFSFREEDSPVNVRAMGFGNGVLMVLGTEVPLRSLDYGETFERMTLEPRCFANIMGRGSLATDGRGTWTVNGRDGEVCTSHDDGVSWTIHESGIEQWGNIVWTPNGYYIINRDHSLRSPAGDTWTRVDHEGRFNNFKRVVHGEGVFIALHSGELMRSTDGTTWTNTGFPDGGSTLVRLAFGYLPTCE